METGRSSACWWLSVFGTALVAGWPPTAIAQPPYKSLLRTEKAFVLPTTVAQLTRNLRRRYDKFERENFDLNPGGWGNRYQWRFTNGLYLTAQSDGQAPTAANSDTIRAFFLKAAKPTPVLDELVLNQTTITACRSRYKEALRPSKASVLMDQRAFYLEEAGLYTYLIFNAKGILIEFWQTTVNLEMAG